MSTADALDTPASDNRMKLLIAGILTLIAAGVGFGVRAGILGVWAGQYGFTNTEVGIITGFGLIGFGVIILIAGLIIDFVGYKKLLLAALICHVISALMLFGTTPVFNSSGKGATVFLLSAAMFIFAVGNGICEAVINPLTAALFPKQKTHYLNILHAGWPAGLVLGGFVAFMANSVAWELLMATFLIPTVIYGYIVFTEAFPQTAAQSGAVSYGDMLKRLIGPFFIILLLAHACVGYVELGTDSWINQITGSILKSATLGTTLFIYTSLLMTALRFFAGPIVEKISSLGLLLASALIGAIGLYLISIGNSVTFMFLAATVYACGKTFLWPTMLGVLGERYPQSATVGMAIMGCVGMLSAGGLGGPGIGYTQDYYASNQLRDVAPDTFQRVAAPNENSFLMFPAITGIDGAKAKIVADGGEAISADRDLAGPAWDSDEKYAGQRTQYEWMQANEGYFAEDAPKVDEATLFGSRMALRVTALVPVTMAVLYAILLFGFKRRPDGEPVPEAAVSAQPVGGGATA